MAQGAERASGEAGGGDIAPALALPIIYSAYHRRSAFFETGWFVSTSINSRASLR